MQAGDTWQWTTQFPEYPASEGGTLTYAFAGPACFSISGTEVVVSGLAYAVTVPAATSAALTAGRYDWTAYITLATVRRAARTGILVVTPNLATATGDNRAHSEKMLALIEAELVTRVTGGSAGGGAAIESYQIGGWSISKVPTAELYLLRNKYRWEVWRSRNTCRIGPTVGVRMTHASG